jgi:hypothetical protein
MHGGRSLDRARAAFFRLGLERLETRDLPGVLAVGGNGLPTAVVTAGQTPSGTDDGATGTDGQAGDDDASYHSSDPSSNGKTGYPDPKPKTMAVTATDKTSGSNTPGFNYTNVSPVGYEHGQPVGPTARVEILSPFNPAPAIGPGVNADVIPPEAPIRTSGRSLSDVVAPLLAHLVQSVITGITTNDESDHRPPPLTDVVSEVPSSGADGPTTPATVQADEPFVRIPPLIAAVVPAGWTAAAEDVLHALDALGVGPDGPVTTWERIYVWGTATAAIALGIELARRFRATARGRDWDEPG